MQCNQICGTTSRRCQSTVLTYCSVYNTNTNPTKSTGFVFIQLNTAADGLFYEMRPFLFTTFEKELKTNETINSALISAMSIGLAISALLPGGISDRSVLTCSILLCSGLIEQSATQDRKTTYVPCWLLGNPCFWDALCSFAVLAGNI